MSQAEAYDADVTVIGSGPGGYVAAIRAAQLGARTICIERDAKEWGGICLNWGCIPTKTMIASVERYHHALDAGRMGITVGEVGYDFAKIMERKTKVVGTLRGGVEALLKSNHVKKVLGWARLTGANTIEVTHDDGTKETITSKNIILATGSKPIKPPIPGLEGENIWYSDEAVSATFVPETMVVIGAGAVGLEFSYVYNGLGAKVTVVEMQDEIVPLADAEVAAELRKSLKKQKIDFRLSSKVTQVERKDGKLHATVETPMGAEVLVADVILVGVGRAPMTSDIGLEAAGVIFDRKGIATNEKLETNVPGIYAIGDVTGKLLLAHLASHQGVVAAENAMGHPAKIDYKAVPSPIFTEPELSSVGMSEKEARAAGYDVMTGKFPFRPLGKAMAIDQQEGLVKIVSERKYGEILGVHIVGPHASDLIHEGVTAMQLEATVEDLMTMIHAHPTLAEALLEAALDVKGEAIHKMRA
jgi:dihydrolipoamide dehydrogenase